MSVSWLELVQNPVRLSLSMTVLRIWMPQNPLVGQTKDSDFHDQFWEEKLDFIESELDAIFAQPRILYHQDIGNSHVHNGKFTGFFDLEMCRVGTAAMQLGIATCLFQPHGKGWDAFSEGWEAGTAIHLTPKE